MKRFSKIICALLLMACFMVSVNVPVYAEGASVRTILKYRKSAYTDSGRIKVYADLSVQDSNSTIIGYQIADIITGYGVTNASVIYSTITNNSTQVYVLVEYYYGGDYIYESAYIDM